MSRCIKFMSILFVLCVAQPAAAKKVEWRWWAGWGGIDTIIASEIRGWFGYPGYLQAMHHLRVWGNTPDDCTFSSYGADNLKSFDRIYSGLELTSMASARPIHSTGAY